MDYLSSYKKIEYQVYGYLIQTKEIYISSGLEAENIQSIDETIEQFKNKTFRVAVVGEFRRGKTTLINALLGSTVLPSDVTPTTATINRITYGTVPSATIYYKDGHMETIKLSDLIDYVTLLTTEGQYRAPLIKEAVIQYPTFLCQNHIDIIDTPGLCDNEEMTDITMEMIKHVDATVITISSISPFSETECDFVVELIVTHKIDAIIFVVTGIDRIDQDERERLLSYVQKRIIASSLKLAEKRYASESAKLEQIRSVLGHAPLFGISALNALKAYATSDMKLLGESNFDHFINEIYKIITSRQGSHMLEKAYGTIERYSNEYDILSSQRIERIAKIVNMEVDTLAKLESYVLRYVKEIPELFRNNKEVLQSIDRVMEQIKNDCFACFMPVFNALPEVLQNANQSQGLVNMLIPVPSACWSTINNKYQPTVFNIVKDLVVTTQKAIEPIRITYLIEPINYVNQCSDNIDWQLKPVYQSDPEQFLRNFGLPMFDWQVSPLVLQGVYNKGFMLSNLKTAIEQSIAVYHYHWKLLINGIVKRWSELLQDEAESLDDYINTFKKHVTKNVEHLTFLRLHIEQQSESINTIRTNARALRATLTIY